MVMTIASVWSGLELHVVWVTFSGHGVKPLSGKRDFTRRVGSRLPNAQAQTQIPATNIEHLPTFSHLTFPIHIPILTEFSHNPHILYFLSIGILTRFCTYFHVN